MPRKIRRLREEFYSLLPQYSARGAFNRENIAAVDGWLGLKESFRRFWIPISDTYEHMMPKHNLGRARIVQKDSVDFAASCSKKHLIFLAKGGGGV